MKQATLQFDLPPPYYFPAPMEFCDRWVVAHYAPAVICADRDCPNEQTARQEADRMNRQREREAFHAAYVRRLEGR